MNFPMRWQEWQVVRKFIFMAANGNGTTKSGVLQCQDQLLMCSGGERVTFNSVGMSGLWPAGILCSRCLGTYTVESGYSIACLHGEVRGGERDGRQSRGSHSSSPPPCRSQGRQTGKSILPLRTVHYKGLPQRRDLSESVPQAGWDGNRWQGRCQSTLITLLESDWSLVQHHRQLQTDKDKGLDQNAGPRFICPFSNACKTCWR